MTLQAVTACVVQPASARSKGQSRNSTDFGLLHGQESSTSGLDRMSSTQVSHTILTILLQHWPPLTGHAHKQTISLRKAFDIPACMAAR